MGVGFNKREPTNTSMVMLWKDKMLEFLGKNFLPWIERNFWPHNKFSRSLLPSLEIYTRRKKKVGKVEASKRKQSQKRIKVEYEDKEFVSTLINMWTLEISPLKIKDDGTGETNVFPSFA